MGNCCRRQSAMEWASVAEYWVDPTPQKDPPTEKACLSGDESKAPASTTPLKEQVKIKITKKDLEELQAAASMQDVPVDRVLSQLINAVDFSLVQRPRSWAPTLHTIAE